MGIKQLSMAQSNYGTADKNSTVKSKSTHPLTLSCSAKAVHIFKKNNKTQTDGILRSTIHLEFYSQQLF